MEPVLDNGALGSGLFSAPFSRDTGIMTKGEERHYVESNWHRYAGGCDAGRAGYNPISKLSPSRAMIATSVY